MVRLLLYSNQPMLVKGLESVLMQSDGFEILPVCTTVCEVLDQMKTSAPDLVLMDLTPDVTFAVLSEIKQVLPASKIVLWVNSISAELALQAMGVGVRGILNKSLPVDLQIRCLQRVQAGELWFDKALTGRLLSARKVTLTPDEGYIVTLLAQGLENDEIAAILGVSEESVQLHISRLLERLGVKDRFELVLVSLKNLTTGELPARGKRPAASGALPRSMVFAPPAIRVPALPPVFARPVTNPRIM